MKLLRRLNILFLLILSVQFSSAQTFTNPIADLADPFITYIDGYYYYLGTTGGDVSMKRATTLEGLKHVRVQRLFGPGDSGAQLGVYWAPELFRLDGKWYIYYTAAEIEAGDQEQRTFVLENTDADPMTDNWFLKGKIHSQSEDYWAIDGTVLELNGTRYFLWSGVDLATENVNGNKPQRIYISEMSNPWTLTGNRVLLSSPGNFAWDNNGGVHEGPEVIQKNGKVFMVYSANGCWTPDYQLGMLYMDDTSDPLNINSWTKHPNSMLYTNGDVSGYAPGHHSFFKSPDGTEDWFAYHATPDSNGQCGNTRTARAQRLYWNTQGLPVFGSVTSTGESFKAPSGEPGLPSTAVLENGLYRIIPKGQDGRRVEIASASLFNGANIMHWTDNGGLQQQWRLQATTDGYFTIVSALSGMALEVGACSNDENANINMWSPNGADCQLWTIEDLGAGFFRVINKNSGKVMKTISGDSNINQGTWSNADSQQFKIEKMYDDASKKLETAVYEIHSKKGDKVLDINGCSNQDEANVFVDNDAETDCQKWYVEDLGEGLYKMTSASSKKALSVAENSDQPGANIEQNTSADSDSQKFYIQHVKNDSYKIISKISDLSVQTAGCSASTGANVDLWTYWGGDCQLWTFEFITSENPLHVGTIDQLRMGLKIAQNPVETKTDVMIYSSLNTEVTLNLYNILGVIEITQKFQLSVGENALPLNLKSLSAGVYILKTNIEGFATESKVIVKK